MSMDLVNSAGDWIQWRNTSWQWFLELGRRYGWKPMGTCKPIGVPPDYWLPGELSYVSNDSQLFHTKASATPPGS
jgi:hypothetical protein